MANFERPVATPTPLSRLIPGAPEVDITGITSESAKVRAGDLFAALPGTHVHGAAYAPDAVARGALAVLTDEDGARELADLRVPVIALSEPAAQLGPIAAKLYGDPGRALTAFAVTGTNGKTTVAFMVEEILTQLGHTPGLIGTVAVRAAGVEMPAVMTTPVPAELQALLAAFRAAGADTLAMEVSSHALVQGRTDPLRFAVAGFTNLTQDHLDFHKTMENYYRAKRSLFMPGRAQRGVVTVDDAWGRRLLDEAEVPVVALGVTSAVDRGWQVTDAVESAAGATFTLAWVGEAGDWRTGAQIRVALRMPGTFNIANAALALAMVLESRLAAPAQLADALAGGLAPRVPGRMEQISEAPRVIVDFAHNEAALTTAVESLLPTTRGRLIVLTGSAGERDADKRPAMARAMAERADILYITDDDPHGEDPARIRADLMRGAHGRARVIEIPDRREAIRTAIHMAAPEDTVLLAGRGHETMQPLAHGAVELDDRVEARAALSAREKE
ncbi:UDP-N-acetylmuramoyl-L-alanyl-D-glutamate--2,6-diaminopimelate ligase [Neoactinobaculum massilliense]|uniref:UDP-N-acetylmuramoyl-L-alanyl-D-glutamate--2, 6-diaminopimelate ligase n=1 Tax=Neoactinobaculum massilliense TaxID=2364794 RepID=UPI000F535B23|nr:UDP-N-acetylmuramoyl-L-alanyl-D-glutamate--2,6-diaminopimelate ligase [Neoactinobaculum massilliense]